MMTLNHAKDKMTKSESRAYILAWRVSARFSRLTVAPLNSFSLSRSFRLSVFYIIIAYSISQDKTLHQHIYFYLFFYTFYLFFTYIPFPVTMLFFILNMSSNWQCGHQTTHTTKPDLVTALFYFFCFAIFSRPFPSHQFCAISSEREPRT